MHSSLGQRRSRGIECSQERACGRENPITILRDLEDAGVCRKGRSRVTTGLGRTTIVVSVLCLWMARGALSPPLAGIVNSSRQWTLEEAAESVTHPPWAR